MTTEVYFYHLERRTLGDVLPTLLERSLERGWRAAVQAASEERFLVDGAELGDASPYTRVVFIFDGTDADAVARARAEWQTAKASGYSVSYWQQDETGQWRKKA
jgi:DNA polymerase-3 subunit chi